MDRFIKLSEITEYDFFNKCLQYAVNIEESSFSDSWNEKAICDLLKSENYYVSLVERNGIVCGYCAYSYLYDDAEILRIAVLPEKRKEGIAFSLLGHILDELKESDIVNVFLEVRTGNTNARRLYEKFGFREIYLRKGYYSNGEDAVVYQKIF